MKNFYTLLLGSLLLSGANSLAYASPQTMTPSISSVQAQLKNVDLPSSGENGEHVIALSDINGFSNIVVGYGKPGKNVSVDGNPLTMNGEVYTSGLGVHASSKLVIQLTEGITSFHALIGLDDEVRGEGKEHGDANITVSLKKGDEESVLQEFSVALADTEPTAVDVDIESGAQYLVINIDAGEHNWSDHIDVANAYFESTSTETPTIVPSAMLDHEVVMLPESGENGEKVIALSSLDGLSNVRTGWGNVGINRSVNNNMLMMHDIVYASGLGIHADGGLVVSIPKGVDTFKALFGIDQESCGANSPASVDYTITLRKLNGEEKEAVSGQALAADEAPHVIDVDLKGYDFMIINLDKGENNGNDHFDIANAYFESTGSQAPSIITQTEMEGKVVNLPTAGENGEKILAISALEGLGNVTTGWGNVEANKSTDGNPLIVNGKQYQSGLGVHATGKIIVQLNEGMKTFHALVGIDDEARSEASVAKVEYKFILQSEDHQQTVAAEGVVAKDDSEPEAVSFEVEGMKYLIVEINEGESDGNDHFDLVNAYFEYDSSSELPVIVDEETYTTGIDEVLTDNAQGVSISVADGTLEVEFAATVGGKKTVAFYSLTGQLLQSVSTEGQVVRMQLAPDTMQSGVVRCTSEKGTKSFKVIG